MSKKAPVGDLLAPLRVKDSQAMANQADWASLRAVWVPDEKEGFVAARIKSESGDSVICEKQETKAEVQLAKADVQVMNPPKFSKSEDMAALTNLNEASVLFNLKDRYLADLIYTYSGLFCVVINPYKMLPIYTPDIVAAYKGKKRDTLPPHVYAIADEAFRSMVEDKEDQSILCTGESGAGKTENTKKVIQYLAIVASSSKRPKEEGRRKSVIAPPQSKGELEEQLLQANPILETFGNASTTKNDNSSRFGKFIRIKFDAAGYITGASIDVYLLEKSRAVRQNEGERNFHAFYQLLRGASPAYVSQLLLEPASSYSYLTNGDRQLPNVDDSREFAATNAALGIMGLTDAEVLSVWRVISAVLLFGQMKFDQERRTDQAVLKSDQPAQKLCHLLGINVADFIRGLLRPKLDMGGAESVAKQQTADQAVFSAEALAKALYERLFLWLVQKINAALGANARDAKTFIGLLDIAGFEIFKVNSFEQLCINFTNEKLQQLFNHKMFVLEQEEYVKERIDWTFIDFGLDLQPTIDLIEQNPGILATLDDQCIFPKATDQTLLDQLITKFKDNAKFSKSGLKQEGDFAILHYAGRVAYTVKDWIVKDKDPLNTNITALLEKSSDPFVATLWRSDISSLVPSGGARSRGVMRTVGYIYKEQLSQLMFTLNSTNPHFVRCIIPNHVKRGGVIDSPLVLDQLRCNGVLEGIRICRQGFPNRILFQEFRQRYKILVPNAVEPGFVEGRKACEKMVVAMGLDPSQYRLGESKIFFRAGALHELEEKRDLMLSKLFLGLQAYCRGFLVRRAMIRISPEAIKVIQRNIRAFMRIRSWAWWRLYTKIKPLIPTMSADQKLRDLQAEIDKLTKQLETEQRLRAEAEDAKLKLEDEVKRLVEHVKQLEDGSADAQQLIQTLKIRKGEVEEELGNMEKELEEHIDTAQGLLKDKKDLAAELAQLRESLKASDVAEARINQLGTEVKDWKGKFEALVAELHAATEQTKKYQRDLAAQQEALDTATTARARVEREKKKAQQDLEDISVQLANEKQTSASLASKQKVVDKQSAEQRALMDQSTAELERTQAELREAQSKILVLRNDVADQEQRATTAEQAKKRLEGELEEMISSAKDRDVQELERIRRELAAQVEDQRKQIIELEDELQGATDARTRAEVNIGTMKEELRLARENAADMATFDSLEGKVKALQRQVGELQDEADKERRLRGKLSNEKRKLELDLQGQADSLDEERKALEREQRLREQAERKLQEIMAGNAGGALGASDARELERMRTRVKQNKTEMDELELQLATEKASKRRAERDLEEQRDLVTTYEKEIAELRAQLRKIMTALQSGERGPVKLEWKTTEQVTTKTRAGETVTQQTESGAGVPHSLDDA